MKEAKKSALDAKHPPRKRNREATHLAVLNAAEMEFAQLGFAAARAQEIADRAGVTKGLIYHYFEDKEALYRAVLERVYTPLIGRCAEIERTIADPLKAMNACVKCLLDAYAKNPRVPAIMAMDVIQNQDTYLGKLSVGRLYRILSHLLERGIRKGLFRQVDPWHAAANIVGICCFYYCFSDKLSSIMPGKMRLLSPAAIQHHNQATMLMIFSGIQNSAKSLSE